MSAVAELPLDLDAFEGPFDLLLTLVLKEELELADVEIVEIVLTFLERARWPIWRSTASSSSSSPRSSS